MDSNFPKLVISSDETHFQLNGFVKKQICRIWKNKNSRIVQEHEMHPLRTTAWCGFWTDAVIGSFFF